MADLEKKKNPAPVSSVNVEWGEDIAEPDIDGWHDPELAPLVMGQIVGFKVIETTNGWSDVVIMKLLEAVKAKGNKGEPVELHAGQSIGVFVRAKLVELLDYVEFKNVMRIRALEKMAIKGGHTMWRFEIKPKVGAKVGKRPANSITVRNLKSNVDADTDFP
jgi:hypothetical protein